MRRTHEHTHTHRRTISTVVYFTSQYDFIWCHMNWIMSTYIIAVTHIKCVIVVGRSDGRSVHLHAYVLRFIYRQKAMKQTTKNLSKSKCRYFYIFHLLPAQRRATNILFAFCASSSLWRRRSGYVCTIIIDNSSANTFRTLTRQKCNENTHAMNKHINFVTFASQFMDFASEALFFGCECDVFIVSHHELAVRLMSPGRLTCPDAIKHWVRKRAKSVLQSLVVFMVNRFTRLPRSFGDSSKTILYSLTTAGSVSNLPVIHTHDYLRAFCCCWLLLVERIFKA